MVEELNSAVGTDTVDVGFEAAKPFIRACLDAVDALHSRWRSAGHAMAPLEPTFGGGAGPSTGAYDARGEVIEFFGWAFVGLGAPRSHLATDTAHVGGDVNLLSMAPFGAHRCGLRRHRRVSHDLCAHVAPSGGAMRRRPPHRPGGGSGSARCTGPRRCALGVFSLLMLICAPHGAHADTRGHLWGQPSAACMRHGSKTTCNNVYVEVPTPRPGRLLYDRAELLEELRLAMATTPR